MAGILDQFGKPISARDIKRLGEPVATPTGQFTTGRPLWDISPAAGLTPARLAEIHRWAAQGEPLHYLLLAEDIEERDLHYAAVLSTRKRQVAQLPITVEAASDDADHVAHADFIREWLRDGVLEDGLFDILDALGKGFSVMEIEWDAEPGRILPCRLIPRPQRWFTLSKTDGETVLLRDGVAREPLAPHKFLVHRHPSKSGLIIRSGLARLASWAWMYKAFTLKDWAVFVQNYGQPLRLGRYEPTSSAEDRAVLWQAVSQIAGDCAAIVPQGMEIEFVQVEGAKQGGQLYLERADWLDRQISKAVLGQTTTTDAVSGGHAVAQEHRLVQEDIERSDARMVSTTITRQLVHAIIAFNFGPQDKYPVLRIGRLDEVPIATVIDGLQKLVPLGMRVEASEIRDRLGLSEPEEGAEILAPRAAPAPAVLPGQKPGEPPTPDPAMQSAMRRLISRHVTSPEPDIVEALSERLGEDAAGALAGLTGEIRKAFEDATDMQDLARRLSRMQLDPTAMAEAMGRGLALAHLVGQAALLDELKRG